LIKIYSKFLLFFLIPIVISIALVSQIFAEQDILPVSNTIGEAKNPQLLVKGDRIYALWADKSLGALEVFFTTNIPGKLIFENASNISNNEGISNWPRMVISGEDVYATWYDYTPCKSDIYFSKSMGGEAFETINLSNNAGVSYNPWIAYSDNNVYVVWNDSTLSDGSTIPQEPDCMEGYDATFHMDIFFAKSWDNGETFHTVNLSDTAFAWDARIRVSGSNVYVVWNQDTPPGNDIFFSMSTNYGESFTEPINLSRSEKVSVNGGIQVSGDNVYMVWEETTEATSDIFFAKSIDNGKTFGIPVNLSNSKGYSFLTRDTKMVASDDNLYLVWIDADQDDYGVFFVKSTDAGETFSQPIKLSSSGQVRFAQIAVHDQNIFVIWHEYITENSDIFLRQSIDGGATFGSIDNLSNDDLESVLSVLGPQITVTEDKLYTIWENKFEKSGDLFLKISNLEPLLQEGVLSLQTENEEVTVEIAIEEKKIETEKPVTFSLRFLDSATGQLLENVNYSIKIENYAGNQIFGKLDQFTEDGMDSHTISFREMGPILVKIDVKGLGMEPPFDSKYTGTTSAVITVVPEFPIGIMATLIISMIASTFLLKSKFYR